MDLVAVVQAQYPTYQFVHKVSTNQAGVRMYFVDISGPRAVGHTVDVTYDGKITLNV